MKLRPLIKNKRGNIQDGLYIAALIFGFAITILIIYYVWTQISDPIDDTLTNAGNETAFNVTKLYSQTTDATKGFDNVMPLILLGLLSASIVSAFFIKSHPVFFFISLFVLGIFLLTSAILANVYQDIAETDELTTAATDFGITDKIMKNFPFIILIIVVLIILILVFKPQNSSMGGGI